MTTTKGFQQVLPLFTVGATVQVARSLFTYPESCTLPPEVQCAIKEVSLHPEGDALNVVVFCYHDSSTRRFRVTSISVDVTVDPHIEAGGWRLSDPGVGVDFPKHTEAGGWQLSDPGVGVDLPGHLAATPDNGNTQYSLIDERTWPHWPNMWAWDTPPSSTDSVTPTPAAVKPTVTVTDQERKGLTTQFRPKR